MLFFLENLLPLITICYEAILYYKCAISFVLLVINSFKSVSFKKGITQSNFLSTIEGNCYHTKIPE